MLIIHRLFIFQSKKLDDIIWRNRFRDLVFIEDVSNAFLHCIKKRQLTKNQIFNLGQVKKYSYMK